MSLNVVHFIMCQQSWKVDFSRTFSGSLIKQILTEKCLAIQALILCHRQVLEFSNNILENSGCSTNFSKTYVQLFKINRLSIRYSPFMHFAKKNTHTYLKPDFCSEMGNSFSL